jgi:MoxR-like ATPase
MQETTKHQDIETAEALAACRSELRNSIAQRIVGQQEVVEQLLVSLFARGHSLFVGVPGLAKTLLISTLAESMGLRFRRVQFTPDLMPSDITGTEILEDDGTGRRHFRFIQGPIFTHILLADEINRTPPKTQAALLEAMQERHVTASGQTHTLEAPFLVFATQNPLEQEGTYPLPEAQLDRFLFSIQLRYPSAEEEQEIVLRTTGEEPAPLRPVLAREQFLAFQELVRKVPVADSLLSFAVGLVRKTRPEESGAPSFVREYVSLGAGPRASQALILAGKARALLDGRFAVAEEDLRALALPVLRHRIIRSFQAESQRVSSDEIIGKILQEHRIS